MKFILIALVKLYQKIASPWVGNNCRFTPTCSHYALEALEKHGGIKGTWLTIKRICRCHPYDSGPWIDPVP